MSLECFKISLPSVGCCRSYWRLVIGGRESLHPIQRRVTLYEVWKFITERMATKKSFAFTEKTSIDHETQVRLGTCAKMGVAAVLIPVTWPLTLGWGKFDIRVITVYLSNLPRVTYIPTSSQERMTGG